MDDLIDLEHKKEKMLTEPPGKLVVKLSLPSIVIMLITSAYNMADTYFAAVWAPAPRQPSALCFP